MNNNLNLPANIISSLDELAILQDNVLKMHDKLSEQALQYLGVKIGDMVVGQETGIHGTSLGTPGKYVIVSANVVHPDYFSQYKPGPYISVRATKKGGKREIQLGFVNGKTVIHIT